MDIQTIEIGKLNPAAYNPRKDLKAGDPEYEKLRKSIAEFDLVEPLIWNKRSGNLVGGHQRLKILKEMDYSAVEVSVVDLSDTKEKALNLALNKISGEWDFPMLKDILQELDTGDFDMEITGFDLKEIEDLMTQLHPEEGLTDDDAVPEAIESICKRGDLWQLGNHRLLCGDATVITDVERLMGGEKAQAIVTSPPYGVGMEYEEGKGFNELCQLLSDSFALWCNIVCKGGFAFVNFGERWVFPEPMGAVYHRLFTNLGWRWYAARYWKRSSVSMAIWNTTQPRPMSDMELCWTFQNGKGSYPVHDLSISKESLWLSNGKDQKQNHPAQMHCCIAEKAVIVHTSAKDIIAEPFGGSGTTLIACEKLGRRCYMMEIDEHYCDVIIKRYEDFTGKQAVRIDG